ncbi:unnamed protein product [Dibothriocephalus latus]|uniref:Uncharacterized protein n=1 Tax=Dibothriocephalus latus TaxID=60516 RepID=A0A3P7Q4V3_DIBLA|nr:unnamed protein product [Dibothriocephalus latus]
MSGNQELQDGLRNFFSSLEGSLANDWECELHYELILQQLRILRDDVRRTPTPDFQGKLLGPYGGVMIASRRFYAQNHNQQRRLAPPFVVLLLVLPCHLYLHKTNEAFDNSLLCLYFHEALVNRNLRVS